MLKSIRILNLDNSVIRQKRLLERFDPSIVDLTDLGPKYRLYSSIETDQAVRERLNEFPPSDITFLGSGDFHHIASLLISGFSEDISVISFDYHPDWDTLPPKISCGSWVTRVLGQSNVKKVILLGISSGEISPSMIQTGNFNSLRNDRIEIYPYQHSPTRLFLKRIPKNVSVTIKRGLFSNEIHWHELKDKNIAEFLHHILHRLPTKKVYVTIDKDCLRRSYSLTNWEEGHFELEELLLMLKLIKENKDLAGVDITGDYSDVLAEGFVRRAIIGIDHPRAFSAKDKELSVIDSVNEETNIRILELLLG